MKTHLIPAAALLGLCLLAANGYAQDNPIDSVKMEPRSFNDVPAATLASDNNYPSSIFFYEGFVSAPSGFANRDAWRFSGNGGTTAYAFDNNEYFRVSMTVSLLGAPASPRKEAGFLLSSIGGDGQFIVNTDAHEVVAFGGPFPFYAFPSTFDSGETITLGLNYFPGPGGNYIIYTANGVSSPALPFTNLEKGIIDGSTLGGYFQIVNDPANPMNSGLAMFQNISFEVPEPSGLVLLGLGLLPLLWRRRS